MKKNLSFLLLLIIPCITSAAFPDISIEDLQNAINEKKVAVIDVNGAKSFQRDRIPGAIDFSTQAKKLSSILPKNKNTLVVAYCGGPSCRAYMKGAKAAAKLGYKNVKHLSAGISGWKKAGCKTESN